MRGRRQGEQAEDPTGPGGRSARAGDGVRCGRPRHACSGRPRRPGASSSARWTRTEARRSWPVAPLVLLDADAALRCAARRASRDGQASSSAVSGRAAAAGWQHAVAVGAAHVSHCRRRTWLVAALAAGRGRRSRRRRRRARPSRSGRVRRRGCLRVRRRDARSRPCAQRRPGAARRLRPARRRPRPRARRRAGRRACAGPRSTSAAATFPRAAWHAALPAHRSPRRPRASWPLLSCDRSAHGPTAGRGRVGARRRPAGGRDRRLRPPALPHRGRGRRARGADLTVLVVPADVRACAAAARVAARSGRVRRSGCGLVVRGPVTGRHRRRTRSPGARRAAARRDAARAGARAHGRGAARRPVGRGRAGPARGRGAARCSARAGPDDRSGSSGTGRGAS